MPVTMICPNLKCGRTVLASDGARGKVVRCGHCMTLFMVPQSLAGAGLSEVLPAAPGGSEGSTRKSASKKSK